MRTSADTSLTAGCWNFSGDIELRLREVLDADLDVACIADSDTELAMIVRIAKRATRLNQRRREVVGNGFSHKVNR